MPLLRFSGARTGYRPRAPRAPVPADGGRPHGGWSANGQGGARPEPGAPTPVARHGPTAPRWGGAARSARARVGLDGRGEANGSRGRVRWPLYGRPPPPSARGPPGRMATRAGAVVGRGASYGMAMMTPLVSCSLSHGPVGGAVGYAAGAAEYRARPPRASGGGRPGRAGRGGRGSRPGRDGWNGRELRRRPRARGREHADVHGPRGCVVEAGAGRRTVRERGRRDGRSRGAGSTRAVHREVGAGVGSPRWEGRRATTGTATRGRRRRGSEGRTTGVPRRHSEPTRFPPARRSPTGDHGRAARAFSLVRQRPGVAGPRSRVPTMSAKRQTARPPPGSRSGRAARAAVRLVGHPFSIDWRITLCSTNGYHTFLRCGRTIRQFTAPRRRFDRVPMSPSERNATAPGSRCALQLLATTGERNSRPHIRHLGDTSRPRLNQANRNGTFSFHRASSATPGRARSRRPTGGK